MSVVVNMRINNFGCRREEIEIQGKNISRIETMHMHAKRLEREREREIVKRTQRAMVALVSSRLPVIR